MALLLCALPLRAQVVQGTLLRPDGRTPAEGVIVTATRPASDSVLARTLTNGRGAFTLTLPEGAWRLRALRIGHRPFEFATGSVAAGETKTVRATLGETPIVLQTVTTRATSACRQEGETGRVVADLFDEARKALLSTTLSSRDGVPRAQYALTSQLLSLGGRELSAVQREFHEGESTRPFQSLAPDSLARVGFVTTDAEGTSYWAPDAEVLLSESFAEGHCFSIRSGEAVDIGALGLTFRPARFERGRVDVEGTLWIDRSTHELRRMEFAYVGLPGAVQRVHAGGEATFTRLPDGTWFVQRWQIRMPRMGMSAAGSRLAGTFQKGGEVWRMARGDEVLYSNGLDVPARESQVSKVEVQVSADSVAPHIVVYDGMKAEARDLPTRGTRVRVRTAEGTPIPHATVQVEGGPPKVTDDSGAVLLGAVKVNTSLTVRRIGMRPFTGTFGKDDQLLNVVLSPIVQSLGAVTVTERVTSTLDTRGFYDRMLRARKGAYSADFMTPEELEARPNMRVTDVFAGRRFVTVDRSDRGTETFLLGRGGCVMNVFVDGIMVRPETISYRGGRRSVPVLSSVVSLPEVAGIEIYASGANAPVELLPTVGGTQQAACGIVALWTGARK